MIFRYKEFLSSIPRLSNIAGSSLVVKEISDGLSLELYKMQLSDLKQEARLKLDIDGDITTDAIFSEGADREKIVELYQKVLEYVENVSVQNVFSFLFKKTMEDYKRQFPLYYSLFDSIIAVPDDSENMTLNVGYHKDYKEFVMRYSKKFILNFIVLNCMFCDTDDRDILARECLMFLISHEMLHILYSHVKTKETYTNKINPQFSNMVEDLIINQRLSRIFTRVLPIGMVFGSIYIQLDYKKGITLKEIADLQRIFKRGSISQVISKYTFEGSGIVNFKICDNYFREQIKSSKVLEVRLNNLIYKISDPISAASGDTIIQMSGDSGEDEKEEGQSSKPSKESLEKLKDMLKKAKKESKKAEKEEEVSKGEELEGEEKSGNNDLGFSLEKQELMGEGIEIDDIKVNSRENWLNVLHKAIMDTMSSVEKYDKEIPSSRLEGEFGRDVDSPYPKRITHLIDCSVSMGPSEFAQVLSEVENFLKVSKLTNVSHNVVYWGTRTKLNKFRSSKNLLKNIKAKFSGMGGTNPNVILEEQKEKDIVSDLIIFYTDGAMAEPNEESKKFFKKVRRKLIWVLTKDGTDSVISSYDKDYKGRLVWQNK